MTAPYFSMPVPISTTLAQVDLVNGAVGVVLAVVVSFTVIVLIASYYRFQHIIGQAEEQSPEEMGTSAEEILRVQLARFLAECARRHTSFSVALIRVGAHGTAVAYDSPPVEAIRKGARRGDLVCLFNDETIALLAESEPEDADAILTRIFRSTAARCPDLQFEEMRAGVASYPGHGQSGKDLIENALSGLAETGAERPVVMPEIVEEIEDEEEEAVEEHEPFDADEMDEEADGAESTDRRSRRREAILDPVTGVLKPSAVPVYMKRMMSDLRQKKQHAALFCIGVNNMEHIARFHGEEAADDVMAGVSGILQENLRSDDLIGRHEKYAFIVLANSSLEEAEGIGKRVSGLVNKAPFTTGQKTLRTTITLGVASHPEHGRNLHHLYSASQKVLDHSRANDIRAYAVYDPEIHDKVPAKPMKSIKSVKA